MSWPKLLTSVLQKLHQEEEGKRFQLISALLKNLTAFEAEGGSYGSRHRGTPEDRFPATGR